MKGLLVLLGGIAGLILLLTPWNVGLGYAGVIAWTGGLLYLTLIRPDPVARALSGRTASRSGKGQGNRKEEMDHDGDIGASDH